MEIGKLPGTRFAAIVGEARSSQPREMTKSLKQELATESLEEAKREDVLDEDVEDHLVTEMRSRGPQKNLSTFTFTATAKEKMLELLGHRGDRGRYDPRSAFTACAKR